MKVEQVMSSPVLSVEWNLRLGQALKVMRESGHRRLPVVDEDQRLVGLLSRAAAERFGPEATVAEAMQAEPVSCLADLPVTDAATLLRMSRVGCLPVVSGGALVGIVTRGDLLNALMASASESETLPEPAGEGPEATAVRVANWMRKHDRVAGSMGMTLEAVKPGYCRVSMTVTPQLLNAVGTTHGGATFALADFAFAVASNSHGQAAVGLSTSMSYPAASREGDRLVAEAVEENRGGRTGIYNVRISTDAGQLVGLFTGTVYVLKTQLSELMPNKN